MDYRKNGKIKPHGPRGYSRTRYGHALHGPGTVISYEEMEDRAKEAVEEYAATPPGRIGKELEMRVCDVILSYLINYSYDLEKCGEKQISERLGIPRSRLHNLLTTMEWNGIVESVGIGRSNPYSVLNLGKAMREGYLTLDSDSAKNIVKFFGPTPGVEQLVAGSLVPSLPESELFTETSIEVMNRLVKPDQEPELINIAYHPGLVWDYLYGYSDFLPVYHFLRWPLRGDLVREVIMELNVPDKVGPRDVEEGLRRVGGKYLRMVRVNIKPLLNLLEEHGFEEARTLVEKAYLRDKLSRQETDPGGRRIPREERYKGGKPVKYWAVIPGHGAVTHETGELTPSHIRLLANVYVAACNFAQHVGADPELVETCRKEAEQLESFVQPQSGQAQERQGEEQK